MSNLDKKLTLVAPLRGMVIPLAAVPDPVFAEKMVGDGTSIDPLEGMLYAPCDGEIVFIHKSAHALTIKTHNDVEVLIHIGLETVKLNGEGFTTKVNSGDLVKAGDKLIEFDMKLIANKAPYLLTQMVVSTMDLVKHIDIVANNEIAVGDALCCVHLHETQDSLAQNDAHNSVSSPLSSHSMSSNPITLTNPTGLHARPAAVLVQLANEFTAKIEMKLGDKVANAKSVTSLLKLDSTHGDSIIIVATGSDAKAALAKIVPQVESGLGDEGCMPVTIADIDTNADVKVKAMSDSENTQAQQATLAIADEPIGDISLLKGTSASAGLAIGRIFRIEEQQFDVVEYAVLKTQEQEIFTQALRLGKLAVERLYSKFHQEDPEKAAIFIAHLELLDDPELIDLVEHQLNLGKSAPYAWQHSYKAQAKALSELSSEVLAGRANDLLDVGKRVLAILLGIEIRETEFPQGAILVAEDLTPSITANLDASIIKGFCTVLGGATSHVAILARSLGIPAIVGMDKRIMRLDNDLMVILDATNGTLKTDADADYVAQIEIRQEQTRCRHEQELAACQLQATTDDGATIEVVGNVGKPTEALDIPNLGGEGVGLLRSEFIFLDRTTPPTEEEQYQAYKAVLDAVKPTDKVIIRTLDVGGDKPLAYLPLPEEENPFLGVRGIRVGLEQPELLRTQLRALLRASLHGNLHVMFPMVGDIQEWREAKAIFEAERTALNIAPVALGIMIEVPSAALLAEQFAAEVDFFSIGTNDLSQYTMAIDRGHPKLAAKADGLHPSVLRLIKMTADAAHKYGKWAGICGGLAGDPQAVPILIGLGIDELSVSIPSIPEVKAQIRTLTKADCVALADKALASSTFEQVRALSPNPYL
ncbi:MAG: phosphoenolpyruvate--protein phosphotransferase [Colwellia sp.]